jgi:hypothetical protein
MIRVLALTAGTYERAKELSVAVLDECNKLQKVSVIEASLLKANVYALTGELDEVERWLKNAERNRAPEGDVLQCREIVYFLTAQISKALPLFERTLALSGPNKSALLMRTLATAWFKKALAVVDSMEPGNVDPVLARTAQQGAQMMDEIGLSEETASLIMDTAHRHMVENKLIWLDAVPEINFLAAEHGGPAIHVAYRIEVTPEAAAEMNWVLAAELADRNLDNKGLLVSYRGTVFEEAEAAAEHATT